MSETLSGDFVLRAYEANSTVLDRYVRTVKPERGPKPLGNTPRLGIGVRMSAAVWPGVYGAMQAGNFAANAIQNSLRELHLLSDLLQGRPPQNNYLFGFGNMEEGHTGSTFEGLWLYGVLEALKCPSAPTFGADADHIMIKRGPGGIDRAREIIAAARHYTFFTLDVSDILVYEAMNGEGDRRDEAYPHRKQENRHLSGQIREYHSRTRHRAGIEYHPSLGQLESMYGKYAHALQAVEELNAHIHRIKGGSPIDLELSIDEQPPGVQTASSLTTDLELKFLLLEMERREIPLTHIAPNVGIEKGVDYRGADGLEGLERRVRALYRVADGFGILLDFHSGDDLLPETRRTLCRATRGRNHFKISPSLQLLFAEVLYELDHELFDFWWDDTLSYARREADGGSALAVRCIEAFECSGEGPSPRADLFHHFCFATPGRRDEKGGFINRERFYALPSDFQDEYDRRVRGFLLDLEADIHHCD
jgi:hypothetical protein